MNTGRQFDPQAIRKALAWTPETYSSGVTELIWENPRNVIARIDGFVALPQGTQVVCDNPPPAGYYDEASPDFSLDTLEVVWTVLNLSQGRSQLQHIVGISV